MHIRLARCRIGLQVPGASLVSHLRRMHMCQRNRTGTQNVNCYKFNSYKPIWGVRKRPKNTLKN